METLIYLDYDDTLFPTSWLTKNNINMKNLNKNKMSQENSQIFEKLDASISGLLMNLIKYGKVVIITNAMPLWIDITTEFLPITQNILNSPRFNIKIVSARKNYQSISTDMGYWKEQAFKDETTKNLQQKPVEVNIISCGDAIYEYYALIKLHKYLKHKKYLKTVRFLSGNHDPDTIIDQLTVLNKSFATIVNKKKNLDLVFKI